MHKKKSLFQNVYPEYVIKVMIKAIKYHLVIQSL